MLGIVKDHLLQGLTDDSESIRSVRLSVCLCVCLYLHLCVFCIVLVKLTLAVFSD